MTDMFEFMHPSPDELQFILEFIEGAIASGDYTQALKIAHKALKTSEEQHWVDIFEGLIERITTLQNPNIDRDGLQIIENKSPKINITEIKCPKLNQNIQEESIDDLSQLWGVGLTINNHKLNTSNEESPNTTIELNQKSNEKETEIHEEEGKEANSEQILNIFQENGYILFPRKPSFRFYLHGIDGISLNLFSITPSKQALLIVPYKISTFSEKVMVSETKIGSFYSENKTYLPNFEVSLLKNRETLLEAIKSDEKLINHISEILCENISLENTAIQIEPLLIFSKVPGFREKSIMFAYQKQNQLHIIGLTQLTSFLQFVQKKIFYIEAYALSHQRKNTNRQSKEVFNKKIRLLSYPFIAYGVIFALILASGWYDILKVCITIGYASIIFYLIGLIFLTWKNHQQKKQNFAQSLPSKSLEPLTFDEDDLTLIKEELTLEQITQFSYECFGKQNPYKIFEEVEKKHLDKINVQNSTIENKEVQTSSKNSSNPQISVVNKDNELVKKYSSFLED